MTRYIDDGGGCVEGVPDDYEDDRSMFARPHSRSALRAGVRSYPCPTCGRNNMLTRADVQRGYQCDYCADAEEGCC